MDLENHSYEKHDIQQSAKVEKLFNFHCTAVNTSSLCSKTLVFCCSFIFWSLFYKILMKTQLMMKMMVTVILCIYKLFLEEENLLTSQSSILLRNNGVWTGHFSQFQENGTRHYGYIYVYKVFRYTGLHISSPAKLSWTQKKWKCKLNNMIEYFLRHVIKTFNILVKQSTPVLWLFLVRPYLVFLYRGDDYLQIDFILLVSSMLNNMFYFFTDKLSPYFWENIIECGFVFSNSWLGLAWLHFPLRYCSSHQP